MLLVLFFVSGFAGLVYEVTWVRGLGNELGNSVHSASLVAGVFMGGLGLGGYAAGAWADRRARRAGAARALYRAYAGAEAGVAGMGLALAWLVPRLGDLSSHIASYAVDARGWHTPSLGSLAMRYGVAALLVVPPSVLMGATLTLLVRASLLRDLSHAGLRVGLLYGANTAGAALGAYATDATLVPSLGVAGAQGAAAALNLVVVVGALALARRAQGDVAPARVEKEDAVAPRREARGLFLAGGAALALSGFAALGMEIVWFRFLSTTLGAYRSVFALVLTAVLCGICLGSALGGLSAKRTGRPLEVFVLSQALFAATALALMATFTAARGDPHALAPRTVLAVVAVPSVLMGMSFPLVNACVQDALAEVGRRAGWLYFANTFGSIAGSLCAGFLLAPRLGSQWSFTVLAAVAALAPMGLVVRAARGVGAARARVRVVAGGAALLTAVTLAGYATLPGDHLARRFVPALPPPERVLATYEGPEGSIHVLEVGSEGRLLFTNGHPMSGTSLASQRYMRAFAHVPLLMLDDPGDALVICFGVGSTLHATSLHPLARIELADLSRGVLSHAPFFRASNHDVLTDPRVSVFVEDGRQHLRASAPGRFDLVTLEPPPIEFAGISALYSREFYALAKSRLTPRGMLTQWLPAYAVPEETGLAMVRAFVEVFPSAVLLSGYGPELVLMGARDDASPITLDLDRVEANLRARSLVAADLARVHLASPTDLAATFVADGSALRRVTEGVLPVTDDLPRMEYTFGRPSELSPALFGHTGGVRVFCPACVRAARVPDLAARLAILDRLYLTRRFRKNQQPFPAVFQGLDERAVVSRSAYLTSLFAGDAATRFARGHALAEKGDLAGAERELTAGLLTAPGSAAARYQLALVYARTGREAAAVEEARIALAQSGGVHAEARALLCRLGNECGDAGAAP